MENMKICLKRNEKRLYEVISVHRRLSERFAVREFRCVCDSIERYREDVMQDN